MNGSAPGKGGGGDLAPGVLPFVGGLLANRQRRKEAKRNRAFQLMMSSTAYQRQTKDLQLAGLNRILGYSKGGPAATGAGSMAQQENILTPAISTALQAKRLNQELKNLKATEIQTISQTDINRAQAETAWSTAYMKILELKNYEKIFGGTRGDIMRAYKDMGTPGTAYYLAKKYGDSSAAKKKKEYDFSLFRKPRNR